MLSKKIFEKKLIILSIINVVLLIGIIFLIIHYCKVPVEEIIIEKNIINKNDGYKEDKNYYSKLNYKQFKKLIAKDEVSQVAIIDNSSSTYNKFIEMINKTAYYHNTSIYLFDISNLSKKDTISFLDLDDRLKELNSDYIITLKKNKIISITTFDTENLNSIVDSISRGE